MSYINPGVSGGTSRPVAAAAAQSTATAARPGAAGQPVTTNQQVLTVKTVLDRLKDPRERPHVVNKTDTEHLNTLKTRAVFQKRKDKLIERLNQKYPQEVRRSVIVIRAYTSAY